MEKKGIRSNKRNNNTNKSHENPPGKRKAILDCCLWKGVKKGGKDSAASSKGQPYTAVKRQFRKKCLSSTFSAHLHFPGVIIACFLSRQSIHKWLDIGTGTHGNNIRVVQKIQGMELKTCHFLSLQILRLVDYHCCFP